MTLDHPALANRRGPARPAVVALHSSGAGGRQWAAWTTRFEPMVAFEAPDLLGYDTTGAWPLDRPASLDDEARRLAPLLARGDGGVHLLAHSYGGAVALQLALRWPERVRSLTLYEPVRFRLLQSAGDDHAWHEILEAGQRIRDLAYERRHEASAEVFVDYWSGPGAWARLPTKRRAAVASRMPKVRAEFGAAFTDEVPLAAYAALMMPVRIVCGTESPRPARRVAEILALAIPAADLVTMPGAGHLAPLDQPARVAAALTPPLGFEPLPIAA